jgi:hypothetical protein
MINGSAFACAEAAAAEDAAVPLHVDEMDVQPVQVRRHADLAKR